MLSRVIFEDQHYSACAMRDGSLIVSRRRKQGGVRIIGQAASLWTREIETAIDPGEARALCRAILNQ